MIKVSSFFGSGLMFQAHAGPPVSVRPNWSFLKASAAIGADIVQDVINAIGAICTFIGADTGVNGIRRQVSITIFAIGA